MEPWERCFVLTVEEVIVDAFHTKGGWTLCHLMSEIKCADCPYVTCNNHPQFFLALQCAKRMYEKQAETSAGRE